jgi:hypothetical protein
MKKILLLTILFITINLCHAIEQEESNEQIKNNYHSLEVINNDENNIGYTNIYDRFKNSSLYFLPCFLCLKEDIKLHYYVISSFLINIVTNLVIRKYFNLGYYDHDMENILIALAVNLFIHMSRSALNIFMAVSKTNFNKYCLCNLLTIFVSETIYTSMSFDTINKNLKAVKNNESSYFLILMYPLPITIYLLYKNLGYFVNNGYISYISATTRSYKLIFLNQLVRTEDNILLHLEQTITATKAVLNSFLDSDFIFKRIISYKKVYEAKNSYPYSKTQQNTNLYYDFFDEKTEALDKISDDITKLLLEEKGNLIVIIQDNSKETQKYFEDDRDIVIIIKLKDSYFLLTNVQRTHYSYFLDLLLNRVFGTDFTCYLFSHPVLAIKLNNQLKITNLAKSIAPIFKAVETKIELCKLNDAQAKKLTRALNNEVFKSWYL